MMSQKSYRPVLLALTIMLLGLFMLCAQKQVIQTPGEDMTGGDEEFREELLEMLDLANDGQDTAMFAATDEAVQEAPSGTGAANDVETEEGMSDDEAALMALLAGLESDDAEAEVSFEDSPPQSVQTKPVVAATAVASNDFAYNELMSEVERLEMILEQRSMQADSLRRIIGNRSARIARLETDIVIKSSAAPTPQYAATPAEPEPVIVSTKTAKTYKPIHVQSGPFADKYHEGRRQFESYNYQGCIETMSALLEENPNHPLADNAQYWIGESYYGLKQYQKAVLEFQKVFAFDKPDKFDDAQLMIGLSYVRLEQTEMARSTFGEFLDTYNGSEYTGIAKRYYYNI